MAYFDITRCNFQSGELVLIDCNHLSICEEWWVQILSAMFGCLKSGGDFKRWTKKIKKLIIIQHKLSLTQFFFSSKIRKSVLTLYGASWKRNISTPCYTVAKRVWNWLSINGRMLRDQRLYMEEWAFVTQMSH